MARVPVIFTVNGAEQAEFVEPGALYDLMDPLIGGEGIRLMNHPWDESWWVSDRSAVRSPASAKFAENPRSRVSARGIRTAQVPRSKAMGRTRPPL